MTAAKRSDLTFKARKIGARRWSLVSVLAALVAISSFGAMQAQQSTQNNGGQSSNRAGSVPQPEMDQNIATIGSSVFQERRLRQLNLAQHKAMVSDTDKLLKLVTELNAQLSSTNPDSLTSDQLRMVAEIEKLAHSVKDKMRTTNQGSQDFLQAVPPATSAPAPSRR